MKRSYTISDVIDQEFIRFPLTLLANPKYKAISLEAKMIYALLLNRLSLSQKNGWVNEEKEVYLIYTREEAAAMLGISYKKAIAAFRELITVELLYEIRQGRGFPNLLYVLKAELTNEEAEAFSEEPEPENGANPQTCRNDSSGYAGISGHDLTQVPFQTCQKDTSGPVGMEAPDLPNMQGRKNYISQIELSEMENSPSVCPEAADRRTDSDCIRQILSRCELDIFPPEARQMFILAIERLYYSDSLKVGNAVLPQEKLRSYLWLLDGEVLTGVYDRLCREKPKVKNRTAYLMTMLVNELLEKNFDSLGGD